MPTHLDELERLNFDARNGDWSRERENRLRALLDDNTLHNLLTLARAAERGLVNKDNHWDHAALAELTKEAP